MAHAVAVLEASDTFPRPSHPVLSICSCCRSSFNFAFSCRFDKVGSGFATHAFFAIAVVVRDDDDETLRDVGSAALKSRGNEKARLTAQPFIFAIELTERAARYLTRDLFSRRQLMAAALAMKERQQQRLP